MTASVSLHPTLKLSVCLFALSALLAGACTTLAPSVDPAPPNGAGDDPAAPPTREVADLPGGLPSGTSIVASVRGSAAQYPNIAICRVSQDAVEISAGNSSGTGGVIVSWSAESPADAGVSVSDLLVPFNLAVRPNVPGSSPPQVTVSGSSAQIVAEMHEVSLGDSPPERVTITVSCEEPASEPEPIPDPVDQAPASSSRASLAIGSRTFELSGGEVCQVSSASTVIQLSAPEGGTLDILHMSGTGFMIFTAEGEQWVTGLAGEPMQPTIDGSRLSWSGTVVETLSQREEQATVSVECLP